ncbi:E3 ubiquitin-protein ligase RZFP34 [Camellia lanceoleosa]|uniref:E3 ubiquitin-protein ligase RZFP34 n=1 Tax=Camellia lanceoleosa TaxID=1840588 RepID=A0ACC0GU38_9ERIC|nr:E3 ubiquitin-protein ligase RZFP34 [Camellia lanceoleosa]
MNHQPSTEFEQINVRCSYYGGRCKIRAPCDKIFDCKQCHNESKGCVVIMFCLLHFLLDLTSFCSGVGSVGYEPATDPTVWGGGCTVCRERRNALACGMLTVGEVGWYFAKELCGLLGVFWSYPG